MNGVMARLANAMGIYSKPDELDWDLFLGCAPAREYHPVYHPFNWRGWIDWGGGALSDMGAHLIDFPYWALELGYPTSIETVSTPFDGECYPIASKTYYEFPARGTKPPVKLTWYDGGMFPATPPEFADGEKLNGEGGVIMVGSKGKVICNTYGLSVAPAAGLAAQVGRRSAAHARAHHDQPRSELVERVQGHRQGVIAVRVRGAG